MKFNTDILLALANDLVDLGMDGRLSLDERERAVKLGEQLRVKESALAAKEFEEDTELFKEATGKLEATNKQLEAAKTSVDEIAGALEMGASLLVILDRLIGIATKFI